MIGRIMSLALISSLSNFSAHAQVSYQSCVRQNASELASLNPKATYADIADATVSSCEGSLQREAQQQGQAIFRNSNNNSKPSLVEIENHVINWKRDQRESARGYVIYELIKKKETK